MEVAVLRLIHITMGMFWAGGAVTIGWFVVPSVNEAGPAGGAVMNGIVAKRKFPQAMTIAGVITVLTGLRLYMLVFTMAWLTTPVGIVTTLGGILAFGGLVIGVGVQRPVAMKLMALGAQIGASGGPPTAEQVTEMDGLKKRMEKLGKILAFHLGGAVILMSGIRLAAAFSG